MIAAARADGEATHVVRVQLSNRVCVDVKFLGLIGRQIIVDVGERVICGWFGLGGACALSGMVHVTLQGLNRDGAVFFCVGVGEAWPRGKISCFDGRNPRGMHWESCTGMQVVDKGAHDWKVVGVHGYGSSGSCRWQGSVYLWAEGEYP